MFLRKSQPIHVLEVAYISDNKKDDEDEYDNSITPIGIYSSARPSSFPMGPFHQDPKLITPQAQKALDEDF